MDGGHSEGGVDTVISGGDFRMLWLFTSDTTTEINPWKKYRGRTSQEE